MVKNLGRHTRRPELESLVSRSGAGTERSMVWGLGGCKTLNVVDGKLLAPPAGGALYYIANREKGV